MLSLYSALHGNWIVILWTLITCAFREAIFLLIKCLAVSKQNSLEIKCLIRVWSGHAIAHWELQPIQSEQIKKKKTTTQKANLYVFARKETMLKN